VNTFISTFPDWHACGGGGGQHVSSQDVGSEADIQFAGRRMIDNPVISALEQVHAEKVGDVKYQT